MGYTNLTKYTIKYEEKYICVCMCVSPKLSSILGLIRTLTVQSQKWPKPITAPLTLPPAGSFITGLVLMCPQVHFTVHMYSE